MRRALRTVLSMLKNPDAPSRTQHMVSNTLRWSNALGERLTYNDAYLANDNALAKTAKFQCAGRAPLVRRLCVTGP